MNGRASKRKGSTAEREVVQLAKDHGLTSKRAWGSNGQALGEADTVDALIAHLRVQVKRRARIAHYIQPPDGADVTLLRANRGEWLAVLPYTLLLELLGGK